MFHFLRKYNVLRTLVQTSVSCLYNLLSSSPKQANLGMYKPMYTQHKCDISFIDKYLVLIFQRVALFSAFATSAMCNAGFDVIDVYPISDAYPNGTLDHVHYEPRAF